MYFIFLVFKENPHLKKINIFLNKCQSLTKQAVLLKIM